MSLPAVVLFAALAAAATGAWVMVVYSGATVFVGFIIFAVGVVGTVAQTVAIMVEREDMRKHELELARETTRALKGEL